MSDLGFRVYPSGFALKDQMLSHSVLGVGDLEVDDLFENYRTGAKNILDAEYFIGVMKKALALLGTNSNWITTQAFNPNLSRYRVEFLIDTIVFIKTGRRSQTMTTWRALCCDKTLAEAKALSLRGHSINKEIVLPKDVVFGQNASIISAWIAHDGGFADLVESLYLMFGSAPAPR